ncbi:MAG: alpha-amylase family glycosyl hydrolase [Cytophagaceae bacterium]
MIYIRSGQAFKKYLYVFSLLLSCGTVSFAQAPAQTYWWNDAVFYEVFVRSFKDSNGDGQGDLSGLIGKLDYLNDGDSSTHTDLGVTALWLMPVMESPSYHGYDVTDYRTIEHDYGTNADFQTLITEAHKRGIKVIIDYVMNHTSSQHPWFQSSANSLSNKRDWYVWQNSNPGTTGPWGQQVWYAKNGAYYYGIFWSEMPDLNYTTQAVKDTMFDIARYWLQDMNADGFRLDAAPYIIENGSTMQHTPETIQFWEDFRTYYKSVKSDAFSVGEVWTSTSIVQQYVNNSGLDYCFEFDLASAIVTAANTGNNASLQTQINTVISNYPSLQYGTFLTNHDMNRVMDQLGKNTSKAKVASELLLTLPGVPYIYYGEEIGMTGSGADENKRTPLQWNNSTQGGFTTGTPWRPVNSDFTTKNIDSQQRDTASLWNNYRRLISIRNNQSALRRGDYKIVTPSVSSVFSFLRQYQNENVLVVSNTGAGAAANIQLSLSASGITTGNYVLVELQSGAQVPLSVDGTGNFSGLTINQIPARSTFIYKVLDASDVATSVIFQIDMNAMIANGDFNIATDSVDIVAGFNSFGADSLTVLDDMDGDGIYSVAISGMNIGSNIDYKYRINAVNDGREEFPNSSFLRQYLVLEGENTVKDSYQKQSVTTQINNPLEQKIAVYPVPSGKEVFVELSESFTGTIQFRITDLLGVEKIASSFASAGVQNISCEELPAGVYLLTLDCNKTSKVFRIVVQK